MSLKTCVFLPLSFIVSLTFSPGDILKWCYNSQWTPTKYMVCCETADYPVNHRLCPVFRSNDSFYYNLDLIQQLSSDCCCYFMSYEHVGFHAALTT